MTAVPEWMRPPRPEGWYAEDLDQLSEAPRHTELIDGALVFMMSPQRIWHARMITAMVNALTSQTPPGIAVDREITIRLDKWNRPEPDLLITKAPFDLSRTFYTPEETLLVGEVVSPESAHRDRTVKLRKYAEAGIASYWRVEDEDGSPVVHAYELDEPTRSYVATGIHRRTLHVTKPFAIELDLDKLVPVRKS
ncbi:Uma2 family endonuclease [Paractinoplanes atraurantiacus]|uniref:Endonuclease, Uma2 family (Restriction endonuclease fold) n=1 Tax=Paractinoplanes atraurantiacus TaxID=1036182 RepID=A0A285F4Q0_9ACTN|nr:Uma2 family endonuclease [Actinoplanes atraurantiacus]SNY06235.1 Endonuclease, Uma2 family (restriction endonuclease fold) [Actinoplanes atraurantiacus]